MMMERNGWVKMSPFLNGLSCEEKKWQGNADFVLVHLPIQEAVGVGGLEPPTSASQTRRAGRLRYTPADKSIIRTMDKRQDTHNLPPGLLGLGLSLLCLLILAACQMDTPPIVSDPVLPTSTPTADLPEEPLPAENLSVNPTPALSPTPDCLVQGGEVQRGVLFSERLGEDLPFLVYLPPCYHTDTSQSYPAVYLLHGLTYNEEQWIRLGVAEMMDRLIAVGSISPFIIILPGDARFHPPPISAFGEALAEELVPWVDQGYRTIPEKPFRAIGGLSRGAAWAVHIGFEHHPLFSSVGAHSLPLFAADSGRLNTWLAQIPSEGLPSFFIDIGRGDPERISAQAFADQLDDFNIPHTWYLFTGNHTEDYWAAHLETYLRWYARDW
jgi:enterochelin esterase-like enzyme